MSTNISKKKRDDLLNKIKQIRAFIAAAPQDENTGNLLSYLSDLEKDVNGKKYGLVFEEHREEIDEVLDTHTPVLTENADLFIDHGGQMNFLLEGDNLAALKLLEKTHRGNIDLIFIDPPYNTRNGDFGYDDSRVDLTDTFRHSKWISFMSERLLVARRLLKNDGVIFIAIDDNEQAALKLLCDQLFGEENFLASIIWQHSIQPKGYSGTFSVHHNYILCYQKTAQFVLNSLPRTDEDNKAYANPDNDPRGKWRSGDVRNALDAYKVFLKPEYRSFTLISQYKTDIPFPRDAKFALKVICKFFEKKYHTSTDLDKNQSQLVAYGYSFDEDIVDFTKSGSVSVLSKDQITGLNDISIHEPLNTHKHGKEYHHCVAEIGYKANLDYSSTNTIMRKLFLNGVRCDAKILRLETRNLYAFIINNERRLIEDVRDAMADESLQLTLAIPRITEKPVGFPLEMIFTYDGTSKSQMEYTKNVYTGYLSSAEKRSMPEKLFERFCEGSGKVKWFYKNGDKGAEYFSIVYTDNFGKQKSFYPDYVVGTKDGGIWIIETKGGFTKAGSSEDIDRFTAKKFGVLRKYLDGYNLQGGIVRQDKQSGELCICKDKYSDNIHDDNWQLLSDVL